MYAPPTDLDERTVADALEQWGLGVAAIDYSPVGFGTHHYRVRDRDDRRWFANVDDLTRDGLEPGEALDVFARAFGTARALRERGLEFVLAPVASRDGRVVVRITDRYAVSVVPFVEGSSNEFGNFPSDEERRLVLSALGRMHRASVPEGLPRREDFAIPLRSQLFAALDDTRSPWTGGPYGERCRSLLAEGAHGVAASFERYDALTRGVTPDGWVVTHGEPHATNVMRPLDGSLVLIDWDTAALAPRERDLWMVEPRGDEDWDAYVSGGISRVDRDTMALYRLGWDLMEIAIYTDTFRRPHAEDANTRLAWKGLEGYVTAMK